MYVLFGEECRHQGRLQMQMKNGTGETLGGTSNKGEVG